MIQEQSLCIAFLRSEQSMKGRMFIGLDLSHAGPQSVFERTTGVAVQQPTVVGVFLKF